MTEVAMSGMWEQMPPCSCVHGISTIVKGLGGGVLDEQIGVSGVYEHVLMPGICAQSGVMVCSVLGLAGSCLDSRFM